MLLAIGGVATVVAAVLLVGPPPGGVPLDPDSFAPDGLRGLRETLTGLDVEVVVTVHPPDDTATRAFLPLDRLDEEGREEWSSWVGDGGELIVADPESRLHDLEPVGSDQLVGRSARAPECELLGAVGEVRHGAWQGFVVPDDGTGCFPVGDEGSWLVSTPRGEGTLIALGSAEPFTNAALDAADNAVLAVSLLGPAPGESLVVIPRDETATSEQPGLVSLVHPGVWRSLALLVLAVLLAVVWRGRRDGLVVRESLPPVLPSAELVHSLAGLLQRSGDRGDAAARLRRGSRRRVARLLGAPPDADAEWLAGEVVRRTEADPDDVELALLERPVDDDAALVAVTAAARRLRLALRRPPETS
ncbi:MAG: DUF4350 domain-containing protein [Nitriliruptoraceae bacterium]